MSPASQFTEFLKDNGWLETDVTSYKKGDWVIFFDTSTWMEVGTKNNSRVFDVPVPSGIANPQWTVNLIEHLCKTGDEIFRLRN
jgi:hypothetical protein